MEDLSKVRLGVLLWVPQDGGDAAGRTREGLARNSVVAGQEVAEVRAQSGEAFPAALRRIRALWPDRDIACVRAGAELPYAWDARLAKAAHHAAGIAAAVPLCDASPLHALVGEAHRAVAGAAAELIDRSAYTMGTRGIYESPSLHGVCAYLRADALAEALPALGDSHADPATFLNVLARHWRSRGRQAVLCDFLYVGFAGPVEPETPGVDEVEAAAFAQHSPLGALRRSLEEAIEAGLPPVSAPGLDDKPVQLHVMHFWGGGLDKWVRDFSRADGDRANLMLATYRIGEKGGQRIVLYSDADAKVPIRTWDIARPIRATAMGSMEYARILEEIVRDFQVESIVVSSLIGHSLEALRQPVSTIVVSHDFYPLCQAINPRFDEHCAGCSIEDLERCGKTNPHFATLGSPSPQEWQALREAYVEALLERDIPIVVPTPSVADTLRRLDRRLEKAPVRVIAHGIDFRPAPLATPALDPSQPLRLVVLGRLAENKGTELLESAAADLRGIAQVTLVGCGPHAMALAERCGWEAIREYRLEELASILEGVAPHAALLASVVPETFSYTLSELWALGIPPIATALGSFRDRIHDGVDGFLFAPTKEGLLKTLRGLRADPGRLAHAAQSIRAMGAPRSAADMVRDYDALLPRGKRSVARFAVGVGAETALTEPYRQLEKAYEHLLGAYDELSAAYGRTNAAYTHANAEFERVNAELQSLRALLENYSGELQSLNLGKLWWRAPEAQRLVAELRSKIHSHAAATAADTQTGK